VNKIFDKTKSLIFLQQKSIFSSALIISLMIVLSSFIGFLRYRVLSNYYPKEELDLFFAAFRIPDLIFEILITGAFSSAFIPIFIKYKNSFEQLSINISSIFNLIILILFLIIGIILLFLKPLITAITPGYNLTQIETVSYFSKILLIGQLPFLILGNFLTSLSQSQKKFLLPALAPIIYNLTIILSTIIFYPTFKLSAPFIGVCFGAFLFLLTQLPIVSSSLFDYRFIIKKTSGLIEFIRMIIPRTLTVVVAQIEATVGLSLTTLLGAGAYTAFYLAQRLQLLPVSIFGIAIGQASLPYLSELVNENKIDDLKKVITSTILNLFFILFPIASFLIFARTPLIRLFFGGQRFDWQATVTTAYTLSYFAFSIPLHSLYYFLTRCFYALIDSRTPFFISLFSIIFNLVLSLIMIIFFKLPVWSLAIAFSISISINVFILYFFLSKKINGFSPKELVTEVFKITVVTVISSIISYFASKLLDGLIFDTSRTINLFFLIFITAAIHFMLYLFLSWWFNIKEMFLITKLILKAKEYRKKILEVYTQYE